MEESNSYMNEMLLRDLEAVAPTVFTNQKLDFKKLIAHLGVLSLSETEPFGLNWPGKEESYKLSKTPAHSSLLPLPSESINWDTTENIFIEGDNLEALKILQKEFIGKIKTIYIDPPYNTGNNTFTYGDKFFDKKSYNQKTSVERSSLMQSRRHAVDSSGYLHSKWLSMMYPRLVLAKNLLRDDGLIFVSIDDNEMAHLKLIMDEIFGLKNFIDIFCWTKSETPANLSKKSKKIVEYILCYQKVKNNEKFKGITKKVISSNGLLNQTNKVNTLIFPKNVVRTNIPDQKIKKGIFGTDKYHIELLKDTEVKNGLFALPVVLKARFKWTQPKLDMEIAKGTKINIPTLRFSPSYERLEYDAEVPPNLINAKVGVVTNEMAGNDLSLLFGAKVFDFPKPPSLIKYLLGFSDDRDGIVLDFFAGSGSTAQAVLEMNANDNGNRKFICVQLDEKTPARSVARKNDFDVISQITKKRIELVLEKMTVSSPAVILPGYKFYRLRNV